MPSITLTTAGLPRGDPLPAALQGTLAARGTLAGPVDLGDARLAREGPPPELARASVHVHGAGEPGDILLLLRLLKGAGIPPAAAARGAGDPLLILAGPAALPNPEPFAAFFDAILVKDPGAVLAALMEAWAGARPRGREAVVAAWTACPGSYVPSAYRIAYGEDGCLETVTPVGGAPIPVPAFWEPPPAVRDPCGAVDRAGRPGLRALGPCLWAWDHDARGRPRGVTAVLGAAREGLRQAAGLLLPDAEVDAVLDRIADAGAGQVELELMLGLPGETEADVDGMLEVVKRLRHRLVQGGRGARRVPEILPAVSTFFPRPWTATQWAPLADVRDLVRRHRDLARSLGKVGNVSLLHDVPKWAHVQGVLARGDRRMAGLFALALETGGDWAAACRRWHLNADFFALRSRSADEAFPWDHLDVGVRKADLRKEAEARGLLPS